uniref:Cell division ATP-binding protein FtsE n=1 Tax=candidate division WOR-3 bacterium TaxID=2052148 RepID=A0A7C6EB70_UNCW3
MIEFIGVSKTYSNNWTALTNINLKIEKGEFVFVTGPTGAGKTTLLRLIYREELPSVGVVNVLGQNLASLRPKDIPNLRRQIGVVFQDFKLLYERTAYENLEFVLRVIGTPKAVIKKKIADTMDRLGIWPKKDSYPFELSGGEQQKVSLARALVKDPSILLADEPTGNIDPEGASEILAIFKELNYQGTTVIMATHNTELAQLSRKRRIGLEKGKVFFDGVG